MRRWVALCVFATAGLRAQEKPAFEVASIKPQAASDGSFSFDVTQSGRLTARNMTVWNLLRQAYGWRDSQMSGGPPWIKTEGFDVVAEAGETAPVAGPRVLAMLRTLMEDRFHLRWHEEIRDTTGYALRVNTGGPKLAPAKEGEAHMQMGNLSNPNMKLEGLCQILEFELGKPVVDQTGLAGPFAIELQWARERPSAGQEPDTSKPSIFTAVREQLGLRLDSAKLPVKGYVIDDVQRPSEN